MKTAINLKFTKKGQQAVALFTNEELLEIFSRYINTLNRHSEFSFYVPNELNNEITNNGEIIILSSIPADFSESKSRDTYYRELGKSIKNPFNKRFKEKLDSVFIAKKIEIEVK